MEFLKEWVVWIFTFLRETLYVYSQDLLEVVFDNLPENLAPDLNGAFVGYWAVLDAWAPATETVGLFVTLTGLQISLISVKWLLKVTPFVG